MNPALGCWPRDAQKLAGAIGTRAPRSQQPPDNEHQWLTASPAGRVIGMSPMGVYKRVQRGIIPYADHRGRHWFRRDLMEIVVGTLSTQEESAE